MGALCFVGCNKSPQEPTAEPSSSKLTEEEATVLVNHINGKSVNEAEAASEAFDTHKGPVTMSGEVGYFQFEFKCLYNVKP